jgi:hypothetical protein
MKFSVRPINGPARRRDRRHSGFTLAEVLAALLFMAIVIPVSVQGLRVASLAGVVSQRKCEAARVAERILSEYIITTNWNTSAQNGTTVEGIREYRWTLRTDPWNQTMTNVLGLSQGAANLSTTSMGMLNLLTVEVTYPVQGQDYAVRLSTLTSSQ